jgi:lathosterol oxidase
MWNAHKIHHTLYNPSPFAVIADDWSDQFLRAAPLLLFPLIMPTNIDLMFAQFVCFFYLYGVYLHWGYELDSPNAHHPWINTSFQHYLHHARSVQNVPYHTGFFFKVDNFGFWFGCLGFGFWFWILVLGWIWILDFGFWILDF